MGHWSGGQGDEVSTLYLGTEWSTTSLNTLHTLTPSPVAGDGELESTERDDMEEDRRGGDGGCEGGHTATPSSASVDSAYAVR